MRRWDDDLGARIETNLVQISWDEIDGHFPAGNVQKDQVLRFFVLVNWPLPFIEERPELQQVFQVGEDISQIQIRMIYDGLQKDSDLVLEDLITEAIA